MDFRKISALLTEKLNSINMINIDNFDKDAFCIKWFDKLKTIFKQLPDSKEDKAKQLLRIVSKAKTRRQRIENGTKMTRLHGRYHDVSNLESKLLHEKNEANKNFQDNLKSLIETTIWEIEQFSSDLENYLKGDNLLKALIEASKNTSTDKNDNFVILKTDFGYCLIKHPSLKGNRIKTFENEIYKLRDLELLNLYRINNTEHFYLTQKGLTYFDEKKEVEDDFVLERWFHKSIEKLLKAGECQYLEFKETLEIDLQTGKSNNQEGKKALRTICAFSNAKGGILLLGIDDDGIVKGIEQDYTICGKKQNWDGFHLKLTNKINDDIPGLLPGFYNIYKLNHDDKDICKIEVRRSNRPVYLGKKQSFIVRDGSEDRELPSQKMVIYIKDNFREY